MCSAHKEEIEFLRKNIEEISLPLEDNNIQEIKPNKKKNKKNKKKTNKKIISDDEDDNKEYKLEKLKKEQMYEKQKKQIDLNFDDVYNNIYIKDSKYFLDQKAKQFKEVHYDSIECKAVYFPKKKKNKFDINECYKIIDSNEHQSRFEAEFEDEFVSSDSYDTELFNLKTKVGKEYKLKTKDNLLESRDNINEIIKVIKICKKRDENNEVIRGLNNNAYI